MDTHQANSEGRNDAAQETRSWTRPSVEVICLACEISAYAPDQDGPLF